MVYPKKIYIFWKANISKYLGQIFDSIFYLVWLYEIVCKYIFQNIKYIKKISYRTKIFVDTEHSSSVTIVVVTGQV